MPINQIAWVVALVVTVVAVVFGLIIALIRVRIGGSPANVEDKVAEARLEAQRILARAEEEARARSEERRIAEEAELGRQRESVEVQTARTVQREERLDQQASNLEERERLFIEREVEAKRLRNEAQEVKDQAWSDLTRLAGLDRTEARKQIMEKVEHEARRDAMILIRDIEIRSREEAEWRSRRILAGTVQRMSHEVVKDATSTTIQLPSEHMKGRIIGREGRNIRAFEAVTGVSLIIDDKLPEAVILNSYDPVRREVARLALEALVVDGRLNPTSIEETVAKAESEVSHAIKDAGEWALLEVNLSKMRPELIQLLGQLRYRTSYGQNVLDHLVESAHAAGLLASELGVDPVPVKRAALLHDIGDGLAPQNHDKVAAEILRPYMREEVVWTVQHHGIFQMVYYAHHYGWEPERRQTYADSPYFRSCVDFCERWDQASFDPDYPTDPLTSFEAEVREIFARKAFDPDVVQAGAVRGLLPAEST
jgi:ribonuclease Y